jgi:hypothetical protein
MVRARCRGQQRVRRGLIRDVGGVFTDPGPARFPEPDFFQRSEVHGAIVGFLKPLDKLRKIGSVLPTTTRDCTLP